MNTVPMTVVTTRSDLTSEDTAVMTTAAETLARLRKKKAAQVATRNEMPFGFI